MNRPITGKAMEDWVGKTWDRCQKEAWSEPMNREQVMELALHAILQSRRLMTEENYFKRMLPAANALRTALGVPIPEEDSILSTHSADCYKWHHECAIARIEETEELREALKAALAKPEQIPPEAQTEAEKVAYCAGWWAAMHIRARGEE